MVSINVPSETEFAGDLFELYAPEDEKEQLVLQSSKVLASWSEHWSPGNLSDRLVFLREFS